MQLFLCKNIIEQLTISNEERGFECGVDSHKYLYYEFIHSRPPSNVCNEINFNLIEKLILSGEEFFSILNYFDTIFH